MRSLNLGRAEVYPRVSEHVPEIIDLVERLIEQGHAYEANGSVYFDVTSFEDYGKLSNQSVDDIESQAKTPKGRNATRPTSRSGRPAASTRRTSPNISTPRPHPPKRPARQHKPGTPHGARGDPAGTSSARRCP